jgi:DNA-binding HxlR family transcriptional regulator
LNANVIRLLGRKWVKEILLSLRDAPNGLSYSRLHYEVAKTNKTRELLNLLEIEGLIVKKGNLHYITQNGINILDVIEAIVSLPEKGWGRN